MNSVPQPTDVEPQSLGEWLDLAEKNLTKRDYFAGIADFILDRIRPEDFESDLGSLRLSECERGQFIRRVEQLRRWRARNSGTVATPAHLTANDLAAALGWDVKKIYRWLRESRFPGVTQPGGPGTEYLIPANTVERVQGREN